MRAVVQRVSRASVSVDGEVAGSIGAGMLVLLGVAAGDNHGDAAKLANKLRNLRIFPDAEGKMNEALGADHGVLVVSNFTVCGDASRGTRPSYDEAARPEKAEPLYEAVCEMLGAESGVFGAMMDVELVNDGPVTLILET